ncbi:LacI family DNA-binding transcriptional regulator [Vallitalea okinawensis]|uniref:LacI family DNA-binding transcriptional regulator n=1 Tax=Vallitalea okinawensis TaxID=2078660 RepID=UPI0014780898|nr:LacI family DNA-binding transcriptional regulator [Vallitalea okinawensis]
MKVSLQFIADKANVSKSLVSKVINNKEVRVSEKKRQEILDIARKYHYRPNRMASSLRTQKTNTISLIVPNITFEFFGRLSYAIETRARELGYNVLICNTTEQPEKEKAYLEMCRTGIVDGMLICPTGDELSVKIYNYMNAKNFPYVFVDRYIPTIKSSFVVSDSRRGSIRLTEYLLEKGYKNIAFFNRSSGLYTSDQADRYVGYKETMLKNKIKPKRCFIFDDEHVFNKELVHDLIRQRPEAIILSTSWDLSLMLSVLYEQGICVPQDIDLVAFDTFTLPYNTLEDMQLAGQLKEPIALMEQQPEEMGKKAVELLVDTIEGKNKSIQSIYLDTVFKNERRLG